MLKPSKTVDTPRVAHAILGLILGESLFLKFPQGYTSCIHWPVDSPFRRTTKNRTPRKRPGLFRSPGQFSRSPGAKRLVSTALADCESLPVRSRPLFNRRAKLWLEETRGIPSNRMFTTTTATATLVTISNVRTGVRVQAESHSVPNAGH